MFSPGPWVLASVKVPDIPTIFALSTPPGVAGLAVLRISGPGVPLVSNAFKLPPLQPRKATRARLANASGTMDDGLAIFFPGPASYTGEDVLELHLHGSRAVVTAVLGELAGLPGLRMAEPGEFTKRAFHNGKLDLTEAEGLAALLAAETEAQRRAAVEIAGGSLRRLYEGWREGLIEAMALTEAAIDFSDEADVAADAFAQAKQRVEAISAAIKSHLNDGRRGEILRDGLKVVLAGPPNAGKSSLLNALARRDVAIVSPEPGTTRDVVEARLDLGGYPVIVSDTAGLRDEPSGAIEREGMRRTLARAGEADLVIWLVDAADPVPEPAAEIAASAVAVLKVWSRADLGDSPQPGLLSISTKTGDGMEALLTAITTHARERLESGHGPALNTARQRALLGEAMTALARFEAGDTAQAELRAEDLRSAAHALGRLTGRIDVEDVLDRVFGTFCIGK